MDKSRTVIHLLERAARVHRDRPLLRSRSGSQWQAQEAGRAFQISRQQARGLIALGLRAGDRVGLFAHTSPDWVRSDAAILLAGCVSVPLYASSTADEAAWILADSGARVAIVDDPALLERLIEKLSDLPDLERIVCLKSVAHLERPDDRGRTLIRLADVVAGADEIVLTIDQWQALASDCPPNALEERAAAVEPEDPCTFVYTSGTTGRPKGVILSHRAFVFEVETAGQALPLRDDDTMMLFLPMAHIFARLCCLVCIDRGVEMAFPRSLASLFDDIGEVRPTVVPSVPRIFEKVHAQALSDARSAGGVKERVFRFALETGLEVSRLQQRGRKPGRALVARHKIFDRLVYSHLRRRFGGRIRFLISGSAPLAADVAEFFHAFGLLILEGYGLTENSGAATLNRVDSWRFGSVGAPLPGVEVQIDDDGEVLIRSANLMTGYHGRPEETAAALDSEGWFHSGDIGEIDSDGFLRVTDRKRDIIVTAGGKNVAPQNIEAHLNSSRFISQVMVYGDRRKFLSALITLDEEHIKQWAVGRGIAFSSLAELSQHPEVYKLVERLVDDRNRRLANYETIKKFAILERDLSQEHGELTPTLKVKRKDVTKKYQKLLDSFYSEHY